MHAPPASPEAMPRGWPVTTPCAPVLLPELMLRSGEPELVAVN